MQDDCSLARHLLDESMNLTRRSNGLAGLRAYGMQLSGRLALRQGDYPRARAELEESAQLLQEAGRHMNYSWALSYLGLLALRQGDFQHAHHVIERSLQDFREANNPIGVVFNIEGLASLAVQHGQPARAARLLAWADATREAIKDNRPPVEQADVDRDLAIIRAQLDDDTFQTEQAAGRRLSFDDAIAFALEEIVN